MNFDNAFEGTPVPGPKGGFSPLFSPQLGADFDVGFTPRGGMDTPFWGDDALLPRALDARPTPSAGSTAHQAEVTPRDLNQVVLSHEGGGSADSELHSSPTTGFIESREPFDSTNSKVRARC